MSLIRSAAVRAARSLSSSDLALFGRLLRGFVESRIVDGDAGLRRHADDQPLGPFGEHAGCEWPKNRPPMTSPERDRTGTAR